MSEKRHPFVTINKIDIDLEKKKQTSPVTDDLPLLPTRDLVLFPGVVFPISLGRSQSVEVAEASVNRDVVIGVVRQRDSSQDNPVVPADLYPFGVTARVLNVFELPDGTKTAILQSDRKFKILDKGEGVQVPGSLSAKVRLIRETNPRISDKEYAAMVSLIRETTKKLAGDSGDAGRNLAMNLDAADDANMVVNLVATHAPFETDVKMEMLEKSRMKDRAMLLLSELGKHEEMAKLSEDIKERTRLHIENQQRMNFLQAQLEAIKQEMYGEDEDGVKLRRRAEGLELPDDVKKVFDKEIAKLERLNPTSPDYSVQYAYLDTLLDLPWQKFTEPSADFNGAEKILNDEHYGLEKVKERILEQLAVMMHTPDGKSPIICLVGAPGVGKTSLGQSIARALGRNYRRISLGGVRDEAEIRGHRRTYIGAMPGRIIDAVKRAGSANPLLLLDEIDKIGQEFRGDPAAALLEVLDPEQNSRFHDNYVDIDFDLSKIMFIATANTLSTVPQPLIDRMEIIEMPGYLLEEKVEIARRHLVRRALAENGYEENAIAFDRDAIVKIIESYTAESGVRQLEKEIKQIVRKVVLEKMRSGNDIDHITADTVREMLGVEKFTRDRYETDATPGVATGLAWTAVGGEILFIEVSLSRGKGEKLTLTGNLGDVMKESAMIALQYVRAHAEELGIESDFFEDRTLHIHVPEGAIPKDGPSAGITMTSAIVSAVTGRPLRPRFAMTGEITLRGKVLPVGGIKEKILAAKRAGMTDIILSGANRKDIEDIKPEYLDGLTFHYVDNIGQVISKAIV